MELLTRQQPDTSLDAEPCESLAGSEIRSRHRELGQRTMNVTATAPGAGAAKVRSSVQYFIWQSNCFAYLPSNCNWHYHPAIQLYLSEDADIAVELASGEIVAGRLLMVPSHSVRRVLQDKPIIQFTFSPYRIDSQQIYRAGELRALAVNEGLGLALTAFLGSRTAIDALHLRQALHDVVCEHSASVPMDARVAASFGALSDDYQARLDVQGLAAAAGLSESRLQHLFKQQIGISLGGYQQWLRLRMSFQLIAQGERPIDAAQEAGFSDQPHFSKLFKRFFGYSPNDLLRKYGAADIHIMEAMTY